MTYMCLSEADIGIDKGSYEFAGVDDNGQVVEEPWDHGLRVMGETKGEVNLSAKGSETNDKWRSVFRIEYDSKIKVSVIVTDSRVIFFCPKYKKWSGSGLGMLVAAGANAVNKSRRPEGSKGIVLLGHIRYEWLQTIAYIRKTGFLGADQIQLTYQDEDKMHWSLFLNFSKGTDTADIANTIAQKLARYQLAMTDEKSEDDLVTLNKYAQGETITVTNPKEFSSVTFAGYKAPFGEKHRPDINTFN